MYIYNKKENGVVNTENIICININPNNEKEICAWYNINKLSLGIYESEERTKEVFEMLIKALTCIEIKIFKMPTN